MIRMLFGGGQVLEEKSGNKRHVIVPQCVSIANL